MADQTNETVPSAGRAGDEFLSRHLTRDRSPVWTKPDPEHTFRGRLDGTRATLDEVVYEDDRVFAFQHRTSILAARS